MHLGRLARYLRLLGFDSAYANDLGDDEIAARAVAEQRIILTRDRGLLKRSEVTHGHWLRNNEPRKQLAEVVSVLDLSRRSATFSRCMKCNGVLEQVPEPELRPSLPAGVRGRYQTIAKCPGCQRLYWPGSHYARLSELVSQLDPERRSAARDQDL